MNFLRGGKNIIIIIVIKSTPSPGCPINMSIIIIIENDYKKTCILILYDLRGTDYNVFFLKVELLFQVAFTDTGSLNMHALSAACWHPVVE